MNDANYNTLAYHGRSDYAAYNQNNEQHTSPSYHHYGGHAHPHDHNQHYQHSEIQANHSNHHSNYRYNENNAENYFPNYSPVESSSSYHSSSRRHDNVPMAEYQNYDMNYQTSGTMVRRNVSPHNPSNHQQFYHAQEYQTHDGNAYSNETHYPDKQRQSQSHYATPFTRADHSQAAYPSISNSNEHAHNSNYSRHPYYG